MDPADFNDPVVSLLNPQKKMYHAGYTKVIRMLLIPSKTLVLWSVLIIVASNHFQTFKLYGA